MGGYAWVTLSTNDSYSLGALVLAHSLKKANTAHKLAVLITPAVSQVMRDQLQTVFDVVKVVDVLDSKDEAHLALMKRPELGITFTKIHCWRLTEFEKCVFLDADTLVVRNCDELFEREEFSAAPDVSWPDCFNSGVFVYRPAIETFNKLLQFAVEKGSFDGGDQGLLNQFFSDWATEDIKKHLPFVYNLTSVAAYSYIPAFKQYGSKTRIVHFIGTGKPWLQQLDPATRMITPTSGSEHLAPLLQQWWDLFCEKVHPNLDKNLENNNDGMLHSHVEACSNSIAIALTDDSHPHSLIEPCTPYREKDDFRQSNLPYQPFDVVGLSGELLNVEFLLASVVPSDQPAEVDSGEQQRQDYNNLEEKREPENKEENKTGNENRETHEQLTNREFKEERKDEREEENKREEAQEMEKGQKEELKEEQQEEPPPKKDPFDYETFFPDETCVNNYLEQNVLTYQPYEPSHSTPPRSQSPQNQQNEVVHQYEPTAEIIPTHVEHQPEEVSPSLPRFLTIPENDKRQSGNVETQHVSEIQETESKPVQVEEVHSEQFPPKEQPEPKREDTSLETKPVEEKRELIKSKSMPFLGSGMITPQSSIWKSQQNINVNRKYSMPKLKPLLPKQNSFGKSSQPTIPKVTLYTEFFMSSEYKVPADLPGDKVGFVESHIHKEARLRRNKSEPDMTGKFGPLPYIFSPEVEKPAVTKRTPFRHLDNDLYDISQCKRQMGNKPKPEDPDRRKENKEKISVLPPLKPLVPLQDKKRLKKRKSKELSPGDGGREKIMKREPKKKTRQKKRELKVPPRNVSNENNVEEILKRLKEFSKNYQHFFGIDVKSSGKKIQCANAMVQTDEDGGDCHQTSESFEVLTNPTPTRTKETQTSSSESEFKQFRTYVEDQSKTSQKGLLCLQDLLSSPGELEVSKPSNKEKEKEEDSSIQKSNVQFEFLQSTVKQIEVSNEDQNNLNKSSVNGHSEEIDSERRSSDVEDPKKTHSEPKIIDSTHSKANGIIVLEKELQTNSEEKNMGGVKSNLSEMDDSKDVVVEKSKSKFLDEPENVKRPTKKVSNLLLAHKMKDIKSRDEKKKEKMLNPEEILCVPDFETPRSSRVPETQNVTYVHTPVPHVQVEKTHATPPTPASTPRKTRKNGVANDPGPESLPSDSPNEPANAKTQKPLSSARPPAKAATSTNGPPNGHVGCDGDQEPKSTSGIAGAIAQLNLESGAGGASEGSASGSSAHQEYLRRQNWETGNMDYMGRDSFDNIWSKICQTLEGKELETVVTTAGAAESAKPLAQESAAETKKVEGPVSLSSILQKCPEYIDTLPEDSAAVPPVEDDEIIFSKSENKQSNLTKIKEEEEGKVEGKPGLLKGTQPDAPVGGKPTETSKKTEKTEERKPEPSETVGKVETPVASQAPSEPKGDAGDKKLAEITEKPITSDVEPPKPAAVGAPEATPKPVETLPEVPKPIAPPTEPPKPVAAPTEPLKPVSATKEAPTPVTGPTEVPKPVAPPTEASKPTGAPTGAPTEPPKPVAPSTELPKPVAAPTEAPKPVAPSTEPPKPVAQSTEPPKPVAPPTEAPKPVAPSTEPPKPVGATTEALTPVTGPLEPPKPVGAPAEPSKPVTEPTEPSKPVCASTEAPTPVAGPTEPPKPVATPTESPKPVSGTTEPSKPVGAQMEPPKPVGPQTETPKPAEPIPSAPETKPTGISQTSVGDQKPETEKQPEVCKTVAIPSPPIVFPGSPFEEKKESPSKPEVVSEPIPLPAPPEAEAGKTSRSGSLTEDGKQKKGVFTKILEMVGVAPKGNEMSKSVFYDVEGGVPTGEIEGNQEGEMAQVTVAEEAKETAPVKEQEEKVIPEESKAPVQAEKQGAKPKGKQKGQAPVAKPARNDQKQTPEGGSPKLTMPEKPPETSITSPTPPPQADVPFKKDPSLLRVEETIPETPPVTDDSAKGKVTSEIEGIIGKAKSEVESRLQEPTEGSDPINVMKLMVEGEQTSAEGEQLAAEGEQPTAEVEVEELKVTTEEERQRHKGEPASSKLSDQILKAIPPPRRKAISEAAASTSSIPKPGPGPQESKPKGGKTGASMPVPPPRNRGGKTPQPAPSKGKGKK